jgi:acyl carrier protein
MPELEPITTADIYDSNRVENNIQKVIGGNSSVEISDDATLYELGLDAHDAIELACYLELEFQAKVATPKLYHTVRYTKSLVALACAKTDIYSC